MDKKSVKEIKSMPYVDFMAFLDEVNRPPGGKTALRLAIQNSFINQHSKVLDVGCNTGYCAFEIAHLTKCQVTGIDINSNMIASAERYRKKDPLRNLTVFKVADGTKLPFADAMFDVTFSGGSTAFIKNKKKALAEYIRVTKPWGFITDINFFYRQEPPKKLITELNDLLEIQIKPWGYEYWDKIYASCGLENYYRYARPVALVSEGQIKQYVQMLIRGQNIPQSAKTVVADRLNKVMRLFNKNHEFLSWGVFVNRKRPFPEQVTLFE